MENLILKATTRNLLGKKVKDLRREGIIPLVLYGKKFTPISLSANEKEFKQKFFDSLKEQIEEDKKLLLKMVLKF